MATSGESSGESPRTFSVEPEEEGDRFDRCAARRLGELSRSAVQRLIRKGTILLNGRPARPSATVRSGDRIEVGPLPSPESGAPQPERLPLAIVFEDDAVLVLDKPPGLVVHPAAGITSGTLVNALLDHFPPIADVGEPDRPGIVHRLDRDTSGLLVVAKTRLAYDSLREQLDAHRAERLYSALVCGRPPDAGTIDALIGRSARDRTRMTVGGLNPREARTHFRVEERFPQGPYALLDVRLETGRTHQIRVHLTHIGFPIVGDPTYGGGRKRAIRDAPPTLRPVFQRLTRQLLHARELRFDHPTTGERVTFTSPLPEDFRATLDALRNDAGE